MVRTLNQRFRSLMKRISQEAEGAITLVEPPLTAAAPPEKENANQVSSEGGRSGAESSTPRLSETEAVPALPDLSSLKLVLSVSFRKGAPLRQLSTTNSGGERSLVAVLFLLAAQVSLACVNRWVGLFLLPLV